MSVIRGQLGRFQITAAEVSITKRFRALALEKMKAEPTAVGVRNALGFSKEGNEQKQDEVSIDLGLELEIASKILRRDFSRAVLELERGVKGVIDFFHETDERTDI